MVCLQHIMWGYQESLWYSAFSFDNSSSIMAANHGPNKIMDGGQQLVKYMNEKEPEHKQDKLPEKFLGFKLSENVAIAAVPLIAYSLSNLGIILLSD